MVVPWSPWQLEEDVAVEDELEDVDDLCMVEQIVFRNLCWLVSGGLRRWWSLVAE